MQGGPCGNQHGRCMPFQRIQDGLGAEAEHAAVPVVAPRSQVLLCGSEVGFFNEAMDFLAVSAGLGHFDVAKPGIRLSGLDAKNHDLALTGQPQGLHHAQNKGFGVGDEMIGGQHQHGCLLAMAGCAVQRGQCNGRRGVSAPGL